MRLDGMKKGRKDDSAGWIHKRVRCGRRGGTSRENPVVTEAGEPVAKGVVYACDTRVRRRGMPRGVASWMRAEEPVEEGAALALAEWCGDVCKRGGGSAEARGVNQRAYTRTAWCMWGGIASGRGVGIRVPDGGRDKLVTTGITVGMQCASRGCATGELRVVQTGQDMWCAVADNVW